MRVSRKMEHVQHALRIGQSGRNGFADVKLVHSNLPGTSMDHISLTTAIGDLIMSSPIVVNAMTGGARETEPINRDLALAAKVCGLPIAVGSQMAALKDDGTASSYRIVREMNPHGIVFANLGSEATVDQAKRAVDMIEANALQIHLNVMQELIMPEGDRDFRGALSRIEQVVKEAGVPVIVKEVGFGMTRESARKLAEVGVTGIDIGGKGGTNFAAIENARREEPMNWLNDWGTTTAVSLLEVTGCGSPVSVVATGGISGSLDVAKAIALGAAAAGIAGHFLSIVQERGVEALIDRIESLKRELKLIMTALGVSSIAELQRVPAVITGESGEWCDLRGIDRTALAQRNKSK